MSVEGASELLHSGDYARLSEYVLANGDALRGDAAWTLLPGVTEMFLCGQKTREECQTVIEAIVRVSKPNVCLLSLMESLERTEGDLTLLSLLVSSLKLCLEKLKPDLHWPDALEECSLAVMRGRDKLSEEWLEGYCHGLLNPLIDVARHPSLLISMLVVFDLPTQHGFVLKMLRRFAPDYSCLLPFLGSSVPSPVVKWLLLECEDVDSMFYPQCYEPVFVFNGILPICVQSLESGSVGEKREALRLMRYHLDRCKDISKDLITSDLYVSLSDTLVQAMTYCPDESLRGEMFRLLHEIYRKVAMAGRKYFFLRLRNTSENSSLRGWVIRCLKDSILQGKNCDDFVGDGLRQLCETLLLLKLDSEGDIITATELLEKKEEILATIAFFTCHGRNQDLKALKEIFDRLYVKCIGESLPVLKTGHLDKIRQVEESGAIDSVYNNDFCPEMDMSKEEYLSFLKQVVTVVDLVQCALILV